MISIAAGTVIPPKMLHFHTALFPRLFIVARDKEHAERKQHHVENDVEYRRIQHSVVIEYGGKYREAQKSHVSEHHYEGMCSTCWTVELAIHQVGNGV